MPKVIEAFLWDECSHQSTDPAAETQGSRFGTEESQSDAPIYGSALN
jgi:hypothetical protein